MSYLATLLSKIGKTYLGIAAIFAASLAFLYWHPDGEIIQLLAGIPLVSSVVATLVKILRDEAAHERALLTLAAQNRFSLGASSHMANIAFDKHVQFSEEYAQEVHRTLITLFREGPTEKVLEHTNALYKLQQQYAVWLTEKIETELEKFESALREIGATAGYVYGTSSAEDRQQKLDSMYQKFAEVMGLEEWQGVRLTDQLAISMMIRHLRSILGTEELTAIRTAIVSNAIADLRRSG